MMQLAGHIDANVWALVQLSGRLPFSCHWVCVYEWVERKLEAAVFRARINTEITRIENLEGAVGGMMGLGGGGGSLTYENIWNIIRHAVFVYFKILLTKKRKMNIFYPIYRLLL